MKPTTDDSLFVPIDLEATLGQISDDDNDAEMQVEGEEQAPAPVARTSSIHPGIVTPNAERRVLDDQNRELLLQTIAFRPNLGATIPDDWRRDPSGDDGDMELMSQEADGALSLCGEGDDTSSMVGDGADFRLEEISADPNDFWEQGIRATSNDKIPSSVDIAESCWGTGWKNKGQVSVRAVSMHSERDLLRGPETTTCGTAKSRRF